MEVVMQGADQYQGGGSLYSKIAFRMAAVLVPVAFMSGMVLEFAPQTLPIFVRNAQNDITNGPGPNNDLLGRDGWANRTLNNLAETLIEGQAQDAGKTIEKAVQDTSGDGDTVTVKLTKNQADALLQILQNTISTSRGVALQPQGSRMLTRSASAQPTGPSGSAMSSSAPIGAIPSASHGSPPSRLVSAIPLLLVFVGSTSLIVMLMMFAGVVLMRTGVAGGGAKIEFLGMKIDAKGGGIASIACGAFVLLATFRPLIDAVVTLSQN
jgi:hypothetical protein